MIHLYKKVKSNMETEYILNPHHIAKNAPDIDEAINWYSDVLCCTVEKQDVIKGFHGRNALLRLGEFRIELFQNENIIFRPEEEVPPPGTEMFGFSQLVFSVSDLHVFTEMLERKGVYNTRKRSDGTVLFIRDNSGNVLEFMS